jgi:anaerobic selenocysteine-containing dehydrogenase
MNNQSGCPLDCYDACSIEYINNSIKPLTKGYTNGFLCSHLNHYEKHKTIQTPKYKGKDISLEKAISLLKEILEKTPKNKILYYRGSGNFGLMQEVSDHFFASFGATLTDGSLCDGAGEAGIIEGRGSNKNMPTSEIGKSEVVIIWGRNPHTTSSHLLPLLKNKTIIVIDPIKTKIAKTSDLFIQIKPHGDLYLAMLLTRFLYMYDEHNQEFLNKFATEFDEYYELTQTIRIKVTLEKIGVDLSDFEKILELIKGKKVAIVCGVGIQKYADGADVLRAIDALATTLGLFGKDGCGVAYLGNSKDGIKTPFNTKAKRVSKVNTLFHNFQTVFIQGANPLSQMPNSLRVKDSISKVKNLIYFGLYENETSAIADLIIPAKSFLYKNDIRTSYSHNAMILMNKVKNIDIGISEYDLSSYLCHEFGIKLESEEFYIEHFKKFSENIDGTRYVQNRENIPYKNGFNTDDGEFIFLEEIDKIETDDKFYLITSKSLKSLNSQFNTDEFAYVSPNIGFKDHEEVILFSDYGSLQIKIKIDKKVRDDCILIYSGTRGVNNLTSSKLSYDGNSAIFQEEKINIKHIKARI